jgi:hypothetical protein
VGAAALVVAGWGVGRRDLAGDELHMLRGGVWAAVSGAYLPLVSSDSPFWGHLPLSHALRELTLTVLGTDLRLAWRLHSVVAMVLTSVVVAATGWRRGPLVAVVAGLAVALDPILAFHAQDAGNYAISALCGALVLAGLERARDHAAHWPLLLGTGLFFGCLNDLWFCLVVGIAAAASAPWLRDPARRRGVLQAWLPTLLLPAPLAVALVLAGGGGGDFVLHADPAQGDVVEAGLAVIRRFFGAHIGGYEAGRIADLWDAGPAMLLGLALLLLGRGPARLQLWSALAVLAVGAAAFGLATGRQLPVEPRSTLALLPFWGLALGRAAGTRPAVAGVLVLLGLATLEQRLDSPRAQEQLAQQAAGAHWVLPAPWGVPGLELPGARPCLASLPASGPLHVARETPGCRPQRCAGGEHDMSGWHRQAVQVWEPPASERNAASFLPTWTACRWEPGEASPQPLVVTIDAALLDGILDGVTAVSSPTASRRVDGAHAVQLGSPASSVRVEVLPRAPAWLPPWDLLAPFRRSVQAWGPLPVGVDGQLLLRARSLQAPWLRVLLRLGPLLVLLFALAWRRR